MPRSQTTTIKHENRAAPRGREPTEEEIRVRAFEIYLARGAQPGREQDDWEQARRELAQQGLLAR
jgi:hypothetical protein